MSEGVTERDPRMPTGTVVEEKQRTEKDVRSQSDKYNKATNDGQLIHEILNSAMNRPVIYEAFKAGRARDLSDEPKSDKPAFILGSGPSLDKSIKYLKDWKGGIICTTSHALTLMYHGIEPTHIVCLDPFSYWDEIKGVDWSKTRTKLVTQPGAWPDLIRNWPNEILLYLQNPERPDSFYLNEQKKMFTYREHGDDPNVRNETFNCMVKTSLAIFASSPPMQYIVADFLGYGPIFTAGVDFGFPGGVLDRFTSYTVGADGVWETHPHPYIPNPKDIIANNGVPTQDIHLYYKKNMMCCWRLLLKPLYSTDSGIMPEVPHVDIEKVLEKQGYGFNEQSPGKIKRITEKYLASVGAFVIDTKVGPKFVESSNPWTEIVQWMIVQNRRWNCDDCKITVTSDHDGDLKDTECPKCKKKTLHRQYDCDIPVTMRKIDYYLLHQKKDEK